MSLCRFRLNSPCWPTESCSDVKWLLCTRGFMHWHTFDSGLSLFVKFHEGESQSYFWLNYSLLTVVLSRSCTRLQYCSIATIRSANSFMFSWGWQHVIECWIYMSRNVSDTGVCVCVRSPGWADQSEHELPVSDHLWTLWAPGLPSAGLGLSPYTEEETVFEDLLGFYFIPLTLGNSNWEINTLFREKAHNPLLPELWRGLNSIRALLNQLSTSSVSLSLKRQVIYFLNFWPLTPPEVAMTAHSPGNHPWIKQDVASLSAHFLICLRNPWCLTCVTLSAVCFPVRLF